MIGPGAAGGPPPPMIAADELARWARAADVRAQGGPGAVAEGTGARAWELVIEGRFEDIAGLVGRLLDGGRLFAIEALAIEPTATEPTAAEPTADPASSRGRLRGVEWGPSAADEARVSAGAWHREALAIARRVQPLGGRLCLAPGRGALGGELLAAADRSIAEGLATPAGVIWDLSGLMPARQPAVTLPVVPAATGGAALLALDALDAPVGALAALLGARGAGPVGGRFTGRIDAGRPADALAALGHPAASGDALRAADEPGSDWRLAATVLDGTSRRALFETPDGRLYVFADRGAWDDVFLRFERGRVVMPAPSVHVLGAVVGPSG